MNSLSLALSLALLAPCRAADFDQGKFERTSPMIRPRAKADSIPARRKTRIRGQSPSVAHNRLESYLRNNAALTQMSGLLKDPRMDLLTPELQERLRAEGTSRTSERDGLLPQARSLDTEDTALAAESDRLNESKRSLDARLADINRQVAEHEAACLPTHPPERHDWCVNNANRLNALIARYNADVRTHNAAVQRWKDAVASLNPRWDAFVDVIFAWEAKVKTLIDMILKHFAKPTGDCTPQQHRSLQDAVDAACKSGSRACTGAQDCDLLRLNYSKNVACAEARDEINRTCYRGGDEGHRQAADDARRAAATCKEIIEEKCPVDPAIRR